MAAEHGTLRVCDFVSLGFWGPAFVGLLLSLLSLLLAPEDNGSQPQDPVNVKLHRSRVFADVTKDAKVGGRPGLSRSPMLSQGPSNEGPDGHLTEVEEKPRKDGGRH